MSCLGRERRTAALRMLPALLLLFALVFAACGALGSSRERCERKCGDDEAFYNPDDDTCFCRSRE